MPTAEVQVTPLSPPWASPMPPVGRHRHSFVPPRATRGVAPPPETALAARSWAGQSGRGRSGPGANGPRNHPTGARKRINPGFRWKNAMKNLEKNMGYTGDQTWQSRFLWNRIEKSLHGRFSSQIIHLLYPHDIPHCILYTIIHYFVWLNSPCWLVLPIFFFSYWSMVDWILMKLIPWNWSSVQNIGFINITLW